VGPKKNDINVEFKFATEGKTRERLFVAADNKCSEKVPLVDELVRCRAKAARLLGYGSYAEYTIQGRMLDISQVRALLESVQEQVVILSSSGEKSAHGDQTTASNLGGKGKS